MGPRISDSAPRAVPPTSPDAAVLRVAAESSPHALVVCDEAGSILFANHQAGVILACESDELLGDRVDAFIREAGGRAAARDTRPFWIEPRSLAPGAGPNMIAARKDGSEIPIDLGVAVVRTAARRLVVLSVVDATLRHAVEFRLHQPQARDRSFDQLLSRIAARFVAAQDNLDESIVQSQREIIEALDLDRSTFWEVSEGGSAVCTCSWTRPEFPPVPSQITATDILPWVFSRMMNGQTIAVSDLAEVPSQVDRASLGGYGTKSSLMVPIKLGDQTGGIVSFATVRRHRVWDERVIEQLQLAATTFGHALARKRREEQLTRALMEVRQLRDRLAAENVQLRTESELAMRPRRIVAESAAAKRVVAQIQSVAATNATVLLLGETGTGKEVFAEAIHELSDRARRPLVRVNCAAIPPLLIESELFGREKGAFTGSLSRQIGRFELASGGTIFLDEIGELPLEAQVKLLRVLQDKTVERLGSPHPIKVDVRIIAATNKDLELAVAERAFREDLLYRLNVFPVTVPPLRERAEDIPVLLWTFIEEFSRSFGKRVDSISRGSLDALRRHPWRGNVRELRNLVERAMIVATGSTLVLELPASELRPQTGPAHTLAAADPEPGRLSDVESSHIRAVLDSVGWRVRGVRGAAEILGMKPTTLESRMRKLGIFRHQASKGVPGR